MYVKFLAEPRNSKAHSPGTNSGYKLIVETLLVLLVTRLWYLTELTLVLYALAYMSLQHSRSRTYYRGASAAQTFTPFSFHPVVYSTQLHFYIFQFRGFVTRALSILHHGYILFSSSIFIRDTIPLKFLQYFVQFVLPFIALCLAIAESQQHFRSPDIPFQTKDRCVPFQCQL